MILSSASDTHRGALAANILGESIARLPKSLTFMLRCSTAS
jgi:hypothetical protein